MPPFAALRLAPSRAAAPSRTLAVWGLRGEVTIQGDGQLWRIEAEGALDGLLAEGFLAAHLAMPAFDLERRLWSGRLAELLGEKIWAPGTTAVDLDAFVRLLGFRRRAEQAFRKLAPQQRDEAEAYARGVNAWIDTGAWQQQPAWKKLRSRPRFWSGTDCLLAAIARHLVDGAPGAQLEVSDAAWAAGWTEGWDQRVRGLWGAIHADGLRAEGGAGAGARFRVEQRSGATAEPRAATAGRPSCFVDPENRPRSTPRIVPETVLSGSDNHRVAQPDGGFRRLQLQRPDIEVRGGATQRPWLRWSERGGLVSDLLQGDSSADGRAGTAFAWCWEGGGGDSAPASRDSAPPAPRPALADTHPWRLLPPRPAARAWGSRLVPRHGGS